MRPRAALLLVLGCCICSARPAGAQGPPPPIPRWAVDVHGILPTFPDEQALADSRFLLLGQLPGRGVGGDVVVNVYPLRLRAVTFGVGGRLMSARAHTDAFVPQDSTIQLPAVTERFTYLAPQVSLNFGTGAGWSYLSGGISTSTWSIVPDGAVPLPPDEERIQTIDYGGGARWFIRPHVAFSFDVRFYAINPTKAVGAIPAGPRTTLLVIGAGVSLK
jgi:hypothetical protein